MSINHVMLTRKSKASRRIGESSKKGENSYAPKPKEFTGGKDTHIIRSRM